MLLFLLIGSNSIAQENRQTKLHGQVRNKKGDFLPNATILLWKTGFSMQKMSDLNGRFEYNQLDTGRYTLRISITGYQNKETTVNLASSQGLEFNAVLNEAILELEQVIVEAKSEKTKILEQAFAVDSRTTATYKNTTKDINQVLSQMTGVRIRQTGGLGSRFELSLNGLKDQQVRYFIDGIPVDQFGSAYQFNNLSVNLVDRIDVYKGIVPVKLGADALGGAINIISRQAQRSYLDLSYSIGSFNTHRAALSAKHRFNQNGITIKATGSYNYSDNNYRMQDMIVFENSVPVEKEIRRFHDQYESSLGMIQAGFTKVKWADELMIGLAAGSVSNEIQNGFFSRNAVGEATASEQNTTYSLHYQKQGIFSPKLDVDFYSLYNQVNSRSVDTSSNRYDWIGAILRTVNDALGELVREKTIFSFDQTQLLNRLYATYRIDSAHQINLNSINTRISRKGENRLNKNENEPFRSPNTINQLVSGIEYAGNWLNDRLETILSVKQYHYDISTREAVVFANNTFEIKEISTIQNNFGYAMAGRYFIHPDFYVKASYEKGYRLPQPREIFGDGLQIISNPHLKPESSHNINIGTSYTIRTNKNQWGITSNLFYRDVENYILIEPVGLRSAYNNVLNVLVKGAELELTYRTHKKFSAIINGTWQRVMNNQKYFAGTTNPSSVYRDILPNTPYFFANTELRYQLKPWKEKIQPGIYYTGQYVHQYYLYYAGISQSSTKNIIPAQFINSIGVSLSDTRQRYNLSTEINNLLNAKAYDNFMLQRPGRSFSVKIRYHFSS